MASNQEGKDSASRVAPKQNLSSSPYRKHRSSDENLDEQVMYTNGYAALLCKSPPPTPPTLLRRIGIKELSGIGKVKVMLRVTSGEGGCFFTADKRRKQVTLFDPAPVHSSIEDERKPSIAAPKMFAFDAIFTEEDSQTEICSSALTDIIHAVINGMDGCLFCFGHAGLGKTYTMLGTTEAGHTLGAIPCAIAWLFRSISEQRRKTGARFSVRVSCIELATDQQNLRDLLTTHNSDSERFPLSHSKDSPLFDTLQLPQHSELRAPNAERAAFYLDTAAAARQREDINAHMLYTLHVYQYSIAGKGGVAGGRSRLHLIDIGNSERGGIPLSGIGNILLGIFNGNKHLPYREHKLTQLLKDCLGSLTCYATMIAHVSRSCHQYNEILMTCQLASRIHRVRRRRIRFVNGGAQNNGSDGSDLGEENERQNSDCDPSSSDLSADTVIYVGPTGDDATDGEHPPIYIPSFNRYDNRFIVGKTLRGSLMDKSAKIIEERSTVPKTTKMLKALADTTSKQILLSQNTSPKATPIRKLSLKLPPSKCSDLSMSKAYTAISSNTSDEQWIDGPRISKSKVAEARHLLKDTTYKKETWIDGPMHVGTDDQSYYFNGQQHCNGYGFMDSHKRSMIRKWVENQSSQIQHIKDSCSSYLREATDTKLAIDSQNCKPTAGSKAIIGAGTEKDEGDANPSKAKDESRKAKPIAETIEKTPAKSEPSATKSSKDPGFDLTVGPLVASVYRLRNNLDILEDEDDDEEIIVPPPLPLIEPLSNGVSREVSMESLTVMHKDIMSLQSRVSLSSEDEILEIVEVNNREPVPMQDSCLQVTEEDIALCMRSIPISNIGSFMAEQQNSKALGKENAPTAKTDKSQQKISALADSLSVLSESERYRSHIPFSDSTEMQSQTYFNQTNHIEQQNQHKFDQLARLHQLYQSKLALANVTNSLTYQRENFSVANTQEYQALSRSSSRCQSLSLSDIQFNDVASNHESIYSEPAYISDIKESDQICDNCRQSMLKTTNSTLLYPSSIAHFISPRRYRDQSAECNISSLRHPDGASNPNLKEEMERIPGNGASVSDPEEEYVEAKLLPTSTVANSNIPIFRKPNQWMIVKNPDIKEKIKFPSFSIPTQIPIITPSLLPTFNRMQEKILNLEASLDVSRDDYDLKTDLVSRTNKCTSTTLTQYHTEHVGNNSILKESEANNLSSSSRKNNILQEHHSGAFSILASTLCGCFSGGTAGRVRVPGSTRAAFQSSKAQYYGRQDFGYLSANSHSIAWHNAQDPQSPAASAPS